MDYELDEILVGMVNRLDSANPSLCVTLTPRGKSGNFFQPATFQSNFLTEPDFLTFLRTQSK